MPTTSPATGVAVPHVLTTRALGITGALGDAATADCDRRPRWNLMLSAARRELVSERPSHSESPAPKCAVAGGDDFVAGMHPESEGVDLDRSRYIGLCSLSVAIGGIGGTAAWCSIAVSVALDGQAPLRSPWRNVGVDIVST